MYGGGLNREAEYNTSVILDIGADVTVPVIHGGIGGFNRMREFPWPVVLKLRWPDGTAPGYPRSYWEAIVDDLKDYTASRGKPTTLLVSCQGGHGRTGTALSILAVMFGVVPDGEDPVKWLRDRYCHEAVETYSQVKYIETITGRTVKESPIPYRAPAAAVGDDTDWGYYANGVWKKTGSRLKDSADDDSYYKKRGNGGGQEQMDFKDFQY